MTGPPRDWDKEMAEIDKLIAKQPTAAPSGQGSVVRGGPAAPPAPQRAPAPPAARGGREALITWVKVLLGVGVAAAVGLAWPYAHVCGVPLYGYLAAAGGVVLVGLWGAVASWKSRMPLAHTLALLATLAGAILVGKVVLDRSSYPRLPASWSCSP
ncbi:MAG TPA: hypothetical protein VJ817_04495 [Gemmatimonadales bacterium]|nr:hypothetical protein [Gemmatimonadales bacterium]